MEFQPAHIFSLSGKLFQGMGHYNHDDIMYDNPESFPHKRAFIHGTVYPAGSPNEPYVHFLNFSKNDRKSMVVPYTHMPHMGTLRHYAPALRAIHAHYSERPNRKFRVNIQITNSKHPLAKRYLKTLNRKPDDEYITFHSTDEIKKFLSGKKHIASAKPTIRKQVTSKRDTASRIGMEPRMGQGNMTKAEYDFWRRKGLGESNDSIMSFKQYITEVKYKRALRLMKAGLKRERMGGDAFRTFHNIMGTSPEEKLRNAISSMFSDKGFGGGDLMKRAETGALRQLTRGARNPASEIPHAKNFVNINYAGSNPNPASLGRKMREVRAAISSIRKGSRGPDIYPEI